MNKAFSLAFIFLSFYSSANNQVNTESTENKENSSISLVRKDKNEKEKLITIIRTGISDDSGIFSICLPNGDEKDETTLFVTSEEGAGGIVVKIDETVINGPLAVVEQYEGGDGKINLTAGNASNLDSVPEGSKDRLSLCGVKVVREVKDKSILINQGKTKLSGSKLDYTSETGKIEISGPIDFLRSGEKPSNGKSDSISIDVDNETTTLIGNVSIIQGNRITKAPKVIYDDSNSTAIFYGDGSNKAESVESSLDDRISANTIKYYLDSGEVVVSGNISGQFQDNTSNELKK